MRKFTSSSKTIPVAAILSATLAASLATAVADVPKGDHSSGESPNRFDYTSVPVDRLKNSDLKGYVHVTVPGILSATRATETNEYVVRTFVPSAEGNGFVIADGLRLNRLNDLQDPSCVMIYEKSQGYPAKGERFVLTSVSIASSTRLELKWPSEWKHPSRTRLSFREVGPGDSHVYLTVMCRSEAPLSIDEIARLMSGSKGSLLRFDLSDSN